MTQMNSRTKKFQLPNGYILAYDMHGPADGRPLFYFHGAPSARVEQNLFINEGMLHELNVRLIAVDRPGMGLSDFQPDRRILDWPQDVLLLANCLNIERFPVLAYSLGGPYGLACAVAIHARLTNVGIVSGAALFTEPELLLNINQGTRRYLTLPRDRPLVSRLLLSMMRTMAQIAPKMAVANASALLPEPDRAVVSDPEIQKGFIRMVRESMRQGTRGAFLESLLAIKDWGFRLEDIDMPIQMWHGEEDRNIPVEMARYAASAIPNCEARFYPGEGHLSLFKNKAEEIIRTLVE
jgi:pimeloyl-ACP methyl ester carboxylesterase